MKNLFVGKLILFPVLFVFLKLLRNLEFVRIETIVALEKQILFLSNIYLSFEKFREKDETTIGLELAEKLRQLSC